MVDPIALGAKLVDVRDKKSCCCDDDFDLASVPESICRVFDDNFVLGNEQKRVFVSLGVFSIIKLERHVQLLIPSYDFCIPQKECVGATDDNPCDLFDRIDFPVAKFTYRAESLKTGLLHDFCFTQKYQCGLYLKSLVGQAGMNAGKDLNFRGNLSPFH